MSKAELLAMVEAQEKRIAALERRVISLEARPYYHYCYHPDWTYRPWLRLAYYGLATGTSITDGVTTGLSSP